ncbi:hypothetical protein AX14_008231 [Amanita brunnescens Koide BX004]|nr:hypothetical protein AX14_008231 [Amanita brunnescens Koide BX004]
MGLVTASDVETAQCSVGLYAMSVYEFMLLLDDEYRLIYKADWNVIKFLYLICRLVILMLWPVMAYMFASGHGGDDCSYWVYPQAAIYTVMMVSPHCLLLSRTWVFTGQSKLLACIFAILFSGYAASAVWANVLYSGLYKGPLPESPKACLGALAVARHRVGFVLFGGLGMDVTATAIVIYHYARERQTLGHLFKVFFSQAIGYMCIMVIINAITTYSNIFLPTMAIATHPMTILMPNLLACRLQVLDSCFFTIY